ncbi:hypothetical protein BT96DRAFT_961122 [Gymnopus androsaceus JB14]|uniref:Tc1-like transposase DDE domain-containing protein n=1 Tax=Gymnopus androsaceus JB14 TaxID=1447944 RepID=A0A6A4GBT2_9AGAR|nr:hypothetical protein BT96DRAFT_961122 [Gymnopus androsaceus JB14]
MFLHKNRDGYFTSEDIVSQANSAIDILEMDYPEYQHVLVYDNATTHLKRPEGSLSAQHMPKSTKAWLIGVTEWDANGNPVYQSNGTLKKTKICMGPAQLPDGSLQELYFPGGHSQAGMFKGMTVILQERGADVKDSKGKVKKAECKGFKCPEGVTDCCLRRMLFNQPDFKNIESILETSCKARGVEVLFLPKFHCELNFIEQCWGYAKQVYRYNPESSCEDVLMKNVIDALAAIPILSMQRFANRSHRYIHAYSTGLNGRQAAWASKKYRGHCELDKAQIN